MTATCQRSIVLCSLKIAISLLFLPQYQSCNLFEPNSTCNAQPWQSDKMCEVERQEGSCVDCFDCDPCRGYEYNCEACVSSGCFYCPGDAMCYSVALTQVEWNNLQKSKEIGNELRPACLAVEDWQTTSCSSNTTEGAIFSDPLLPANMWLYDMMNVEPVWAEGILGKGVRIRVNDIGGVEATHAEFGNRFDSNHSCESYLPPDLVAGLPISAVSQHGTAVASLALGGANNGQCAVGIAPEATLSACSLPAVGHPSVYGTIMTTYLDAQDVSINSWSLGSCLQKQLARTRRLQRQLQEVTTCPFSTNFSSSPCWVCGSTLKSTSNATQLSSECQKSVLSYCSNRFESDPEACSDFLSIYAECDYDSVLTHEELVALETGVQQGRNGKGLIFVMSAGNNNVYGDSTNGQKWVNTRYTISVGAVDKNALHASYSARGSSLFVTAPGGSLNHLANNFVAKVGGGCHDISAGTSFSAPLLAGVVGLMLEVNADLTWREVQGILATTSKQVDPEEESWVRNAAGFHHSYKYGFGLVDAQAAVAAAKSWVSWPPDEFNVTVHSETINLQIPETESENSATTNLTVNTNGLKVQVESVAVLLSIEHPSRGDLEIILTSPQGTESILHMSPRPENNNLNASKYWELMTVRSWGENPDGLWTLSLQDLKPGNLADTCVDVPWEYLYPPGPSVPDGVKVTCSSIKRTGACKDGIVANENVALLFSADFINPLHSCCACGGGMAPTEQAKLNSWTLVVYGRPLVETEDSVAADVQRSGAYVADKDVRSGAMYLFSRHFWVITLCWTILATCPSV